MADRLRDLLDLVVSSLDDPAADGRALADRAHFSRDHLDRLLAAATGESPVALRRRLLLERAAWQLRSGAATAAAAAPLAGYGSASAFSRAFTRAYGMTPRAFAAGDGAVQLDAPNGIHFHPPGGPARRRGGRATAATSPTAWSLFILPGRANSSRPPRPLTARRSSGRCGRGSWSPGSRASRRRAARDG